MWDKTAINGNKLDFDIVCESDLVARKYQIRSIPTLLIFKEGEVVWRQSGVPQKQMIVESVKQFI